MAFHPKADSLRARHPLAEHRGRHWGSLAGLLLAAAVVLPAPLTAATPEESLVGAERLTKDGNSSAAAKVYEDFLKRYPDHSQAFETRYRLGRCYEDLGKLEEAVEQYTAVANTQAKFRGRDEALFSLGKLQASLKNHKEAVAILEKLLAGGGGLYEDDALMLAGGYYAILTKWDDAAAKFNILRRRTSPLAPVAAYKLALLWLHAEKLDDAVQAITYLAEKWPSDVHLPELLLKVAALNRQKGKLDVAAGLCEQVRTRFPGSQEAVAAEYLLGVILHERKDFAGATKTLDAVGKYTQPSLRAFAAEALVLAAQIWQRDLKDQDQALQRFEVAANLVRDIETARKTEILEQCWFNLAEANYLKKNWAVALDYYLMLRSLGTKINVLGRIIACQDALGEKARPDITLDDQFWKDIIAKQPGTLAAAEAAIAIQDQALGRLDRNRNPRDPRSAVATAALAVEYQQILKTYVTVLTPDLTAYCHAQNGYCLGHGGTKESWATAIVAYEKSISILPADSSNRYRVPGLEAVARIAEIAGNTNLARKKYQELFDITRKQALEEKADVKLQAKANDYLKGMITRVAGDDAVKDAIADTEKLIADAGPLSDVARNARFYLAELHYLRKDFSKAAKSWKEFIITYGPKQDGDGNFTAAFVPADDEVTKQIQDASGRIAQAWYMQGHERNMVAAYQWLVKNLPERNRWLPEAKYWLALELGKGKAGETKENRKALAEALWTQVVCKSLVPAEFAKNWQPWVAANDDSAVRYVRAAMMRAGQIWLELGEHERAAAVFQCFLDRYQRDPSRLSEPERVAYALDDQVPIARYALGSAYKELGDLTRLINAWKPYLDGLRDPSNQRFRLSALKILGVQAGTADNYQIAVNAYAALLDEYGENKLDPKTNQAIPIPAQERLNRSSRWDGIRLPVPKDLDQGEIRYNLGVLHFKKDDFTQAALALQPFADDPALAKNPSRDRALFMAGQSQFRRSDFAGAGKTLAILKRDHPRFPAIEEVAIWTGRAWIEAKAWKDFDACFQQFNREFPRSDWRTRLEVLSGRSLLGQGKTAEGLAVLKSLAKADTYEDVKADAAFQVAVTVRSGPPPNPKEAMTWFETSVATFARETSLLEAARCAQQLKAFEKSRDLLERLLRDFPKGDRQAIDEARALLVAVQKELAKSPANK